jgi:hypothetical protein
MIASQRAIHRCGLAVTCAFIATATVITVVAQREQPLQLSILDARPLKAAIEQLESRYGWIITYEDPPYENITDLDDVTSRVAKNPDPKKGKVLVPRQRGFEFKYPAASEPRAEAVLAAVIRDYNMASNNDGFRLLRTGNIFHVVPSVSDNKIGLPTNRQSRLDVRVTIPESDRSVLATVELVLAQVRELTGVAVVMGRAPTNLLTQKKLRTGANNETARDVLLRALTSTGSDFTWRMPCDPGVTKMCFFDLHVVKPPQ